MTSSPSPDGQLESLSISVTCAETTQECVQTDACSQSEPVPAEAPSNASSVHEVPVEAQAETVKDETVPETKEEVPVETKDERPDETKVETEGAKEPTETCGEPSPDAGPDVQRSPEKKSKSARAGLIFPVARVRRLLKARSPGKVAVTAAVYLTAALEYMAAEMLELSGDETQARKRVRIGPRDIQMAFEHDEEFYELRQRLGAIIPGGGVRPNPLLWTKQTKHARADSDDETEEDEPAKKRLKQPKAHIKPKKARA